VGQAKYVSEHLATVDILHTTLKIIDLQYTVYVQSNLNINVIHVKI
jgi:hypothetical protein